MEPVEIEKLARHHRFDVDEYLRDNPESFAARLKPRDGIDGDQWWIQYGENMVRGVAGFGKSIAAAYEDFELDCATAAADRLNPDLNGETRYAKRRNSDG